MSPAKIKCIDGFIITDDDIGRHHTSLHNKIHDLEEEVKNLKKEIESLKSGGSQPDSGSIDPKLQPWIDGSFWRGK